MGTHIHFIDPVSANKSVWHLGYQDVLAVGKLFAAGKLSVERAVSLGGPAMVSPEIVWTRIGASLDELLTPQGPGEDVRIISGSILGGRNACGPLAYLGRYHTQAFPPSPGTGRRFLGWLLPKSKSQRATAPYPRKSPGPGSRWVPTSPSCP